MITYKLTRSRRKTVAIHITKDAAVEVRAPLKMPKSDIDKFVREKEKWIETHKNQREQINENKSTFKLNYGDMVLFYGNEYPIRAKEGTQAGFDGESFYMSSNFTPDYIKNIVVKIYKILASRI